MNQQNTLKNKLKRNKKCRAIRLYEVESLINQMLKDKITKN